MKKHTCKGMLIGLAVTLFLVSSVLTVFASEAVPESALPIADSTVNKSNTSSSLSFTSAFAAGSALTAGDTVYFGNYEQDGDSSNGKEPILWRVLENTGSELFLLSEYGLDSMAFGPAKTAITWESSTLRFWLNTTFFEDAFSPEEQSQINLSKVFVPQIPEIPVFQGYSTEDHIFLLSLREVLDTQYFADNDSRIVSLTDFTSSKNGGMQNWMLTTISGRQMTNITIGADGSKSEQLSANENLVVRPALKMALPPKTFTVSISANPSTGGTTTEGGICFENQVLEVKAYPNEGYEFLNWTENDLVLSTSEIYSFTLTKDRVLVANFKEITPTQSVPPSESSSPQPASSSSPDQPAPPPATSPTRPSASSALAVPTSSQSDASSRVQSAISSRGQSSSSASSASAVSSNQNAGTASSSSSAEIISVLQEETIQQLEETNTPIFTIGNRQIPLFSPSQLFVWSFFNLLLAITAFSFSIFTLIQMVKQRMHKGAKLYLRIGSLVSGLALILIYLLTSNFSGIMVIFDSWSPVLVLILLLQLLALFVLPKK